MDETGGRLDVGIDGWITGCLRGRGRRRSRRRGGGEEETGGGGGGGG